jgi:DNA-binding NtrC family response regulator
MGELMKKKPKVLLVDDCKEIVDGLKSFLGLKYEVCTASDGLEGLRAFEESKKKPDLVITDLTIPLISGIGLISHLKEQSPQTPVIIMTGWSDDPVKLKREAKADTVLMKPFELEDLDRSVSRLLSVKR